MEQPDRFDGLVLVDGNYRGYGNKGHDPFVDLLRSDFEAAIYGFMERCTPGEGFDHIRRWGRDILRRSGSAAAARLIESGEGFDITERLGEVRIPTLIIPSSRDHIVPFALSEELAARIPRSKLVVIESESHVPTIAYADEVVAAIEQFFRES